VIILDLHLPHVSGGKILGVIRQTESLAQTQVIITTADATLAAALRQPSDLVLIKPISFLQLRDLAKQLREAITETADQSTRPGSC
jgi:CheY-like chemotaxis protein